MTRLLISGQVQDGRKPLQVRVSAPAGAGASREVSP